MNKKPRTKKVSRLRKFYVWKYSGLVVVPTAVVLILTAWFWYTSTLEFFDSFSCQGLIDYVTYDRDLGEGIPMHSELTEEQHAHLHEIIAPCIEKFSDIKP